MVEQRPGQAAQRPQRREQQQLPDLRGALKVGKETTPNTSRRGDRTEKFALPSLVLYVNSPKENIFVESALPHRSSDVRTTYKV